MNNINGNLRAIFADPDWLSKVGIGSLINGSAFALLLINIVFLPFCFCLWSFSSGYILSTAHTKINNQCAILPAWKNWTDLLIAGGIWLAIWTGYFFLIIAAGAASLLLAAATGWIDILSAAFLPWATITWSLLALLASLVSLFSFYLMINFGEQQNIAAAFAITDIWARLASQPKNMLKAWLIQLGLVYLAVLIPLATVVGIFLIPSTLFGPSCWGLSVKRRLANYRLPAINKGAALKFRGPNVLLLF